MQTELLFRYQLDIRRKRTDGQGWNTQGERDRDKEKES